MDELPAFIFRNQSDLDRPRQGLVGIRQQPMPDLEASFSPSLP